MTTACYCDRCGVEIDAQYARGCDGCSGTFCRDCTDMCEHCGNVGCLDCICKCQAPTCYCGKPIPTGRDRYCSAHCQQGRHARARRSNSRIRESIARARRQTT